MEDKPSTATETEYTGAWWMAKIRERAQVLDKKWRNSAEKVVDRYLDDRENTTGMDNASKYNIFWANTQILKSALYAQPPKPTVSRQNGDANDDVARVAAMMLERMLRIDFDKDECDMHDAFDLAVEDRLIPGLGQVWLRYSAEVEDYTIPAAVDFETGVELAPAQKAQRIIEEEIETDYVNWRDFFWSPARTAEEIWWVGRRVWMSKSKFTKRFGDKKYEELKLTAQTTREVDGYLPKGFKDGKVEVFEIWCEPTKTVYWCTDLMSEVLDSKPDPYGLDDFFPCPVPMLATHTTRDLIPRPDYVMAQDQYAELDTLNDRINTLTRALRLVGVYDSTQPDLAKIITGGEFNMIPVDNWAALSEMGGMKGAVDWFPVEQIAVVLAKLMEQRQAVIAQIYELSGISDIMRGSSNPRETAKAQQLKAQYSSVRLQLIQRQVGQFVRAAMRIKAELISKMFQPQTIIEQSQIQYTNSAQFAEQAVQLIKNEGMSKYRLEVDEQSLSISDYNAEREMRTEYLTAVGQFLSQAGGVIQTAPQAMPYLLRMIQWVTSSFRGSSDVETILDEAIAAAIQNPPQIAGPQQKPASPPPPDPAQVEMARAQGKIMVDNNQHRNNLQQIVAQTRADIVREQAKPQPPATRSQ